MLTTLIIKGELSIEARSVCAEAETLESVQLATGGVIVTDEMLEKELENS